MKTLSDSPTEYFVRIRYDKHANQHVALVKSHLETLLSQPRSSIKLRRIAIIAEFYLETLSIGSIIELIGRFPHPIDLYIRDNYPNYLEAYHKWKNIGTLYVPTILPTMGVLVHNSDLTRCIHVKFPRPHNAATLRDMFDGNYNRGELKRVMDLCTIADEFLSLPADKLKDYLMVDRADHVPYNPDMGYVLRCNKERLAYFQRVQLVVYMQRNRPNTMWSRLDRNIVAHVFSFLSSSDWVGKVRLAPKNPTYAKPAVKLMRKLNERVLKEANTRNRLEEADAREIALHKELRELPEKKRKLEEEVQERAQGSAQYLEKYAKKRADLLEKRLKKRRILMGAKKKDAL